MINLNNLHDSDSEVYSFMKQEAIRQETHIELIASENYVSQAVLEAAGSVLTNKYAEGYPGRRYYGGCEHVDGVEQLAIDRAKKLFGAEYANVQPHSGSQANHAIFNAFLKPGDTILGLDLEQGGHLTHGSSVNLSGQIYKAISYGLNEREEIDYEQIRVLAHSHKPKMIIGGASAYSLKIDWRKLRQIADEVKAILFVDMAHYAGLIAAGVYPSPVPFADVIGSTTHKTLRGPRGGLILAKQKYAKQLDSSIFPRTQGGPLLHIIAAKAVCFKEAQSLEFVEYQSQVLFNCKIMSDVLVERGFRIISGRTESHLVLVDLRSKNLTGKEAENLLATVNVTTNKNSIPNDPLSPMVTSGIRLGTAAMTTRGFGPKEIIELTHCIADVLDKPENQNVRNEVRKKIKRLAEHFPAYQSVKFESYSMATAD